MLSERRRELNALIEAALEIPDEERAAWLDARSDLSDELCAEAREILVDEESAEDFLEKPAIDSWLEQQRASQEELSPGARLGPYQVERWLGHGGMGFVVLAVRSDDEFRQKVAIKIADEASSPETLRRFRLERQILSDLDHVNIARLLDGGSTEQGRPYLVMEHIEGQTLDLFCEGLDTRQRLVLLRRILAAVAYAHRHLVMHLDLKPANILVTHQGEPKLLDFGIAKLLDPVGAGVTWTHAPRPFTPQYASPEQLRGQRLSTASDVYSLGLILYRLLADDLPPRREGDQPGGRTSMSHSPEAGRLNGDLEAIVCKALEWDPAARYASVEQMDEDLRRHLEGEPILARPPTWRYRAGRFARRHWAVLSLVSTLLLTTSAAAIVLSIQARHLDGERARAERAGADAEDVATFMIDLLGRFEPGELETSTLTVPDVLDQGREALDQNAQRPAVRARLLDALGSAYLGWGRFDAAAPLLEEALDIRRYEKARADFESSFGNSQVPVATSLNNLGRLAREQGEFDRAMAAHREALDILRATHGSDHLEVAATLGWMADTAYAQTDLQAALGFYQQAHAIHRRHLGEDDPQIVANLRNLAKTSSYLGRNGDAIRFATSAVELAKRIWQAGHPQTADSQRTLGVALTYGGKGDEGVLVVREAVELQKRFLGEEHPKTLEVINDLGAILLYLGRSAEAATILRPNFLRIESLYGADHQRTAMAAHNLGQALSSEGRLDEAEELLRKSLSIMRRTQPDNDGIYHPLGQLAEILIGQGRPEKALPFAIEARDRVRRAQGPEWPELEYYEELIQRSSS